MKKFLNSFYIHLNFFVWLLVVAGLFLVSFFVKWLFEVAFVAFLLFILLVFVDAFILYGVKKGIIGRRILPEKLSNSDENPIVISVENKYPFSVFVELIDEIPFQFQKRNFSINSKILLKESKEFQYLLRPTERGIYEFGKLNVYVFSVLKLIIRRFSFSEKAEIASYPSFIQMKKYDMMAFSQHLFEFGVKKIRRVGHTMEFEHIREYVQGNDIRTINWKASSKHSRLMVNQYQDEKSQPVYMLIDKGRTMQMPFEELTLLDYAINTTLALSNIILKKNDKAGMFTFSKKTEDKIIADRKSGQMYRIMEALYAIKTDFLESDFGRLYADINYGIKQRSLIMLYTNFETKNALYRQLPYLKAIAKKHLLVVIFFKNTELDQLINKRSNSLQQVYDKVIAEKFAFEKRLIVQELSKHGILSILTTPKDLTISSINKYLELKAKGLA